MSRKRTDYTAKHEWVDPRPFADFVNARLLKSETEKDGENQFAAGMGPAQRVAEELGWGYSDTAARRLYRYRRQITDTKDRNGKRIVKKSERIRRDVVEDACHHAGVDFYTLYPELDHERHGELAPEGWCPACQEHVMVVEDDQCAWCGWKITPGHMRPSAPVLPLQPGEAAFERALQLRAAGLSYSALVQVMGIYHGLWRKDDYWRKALRARGVAPAKDGFGGKKLEAA